MNPKQRFLALCSVVENGRLVRRKSVQQPEFPEAAGRPDERVRGAEEAQPQEHRQTLRCGGRGQCRLAVQNPSVLISVPISTSVLSL